MAKRTVKNFKLPIRYILLAKHTTHTGAGEAQRVRDGCTIFKR